MRKLSQMLHRRHRFYKPGGFVALEINYVLIQLAVSMVAGFGVLFVYRFGETMREGLLWVAAFYGLQRLVVALLLHFVALAIPKFGYRKVMLMAVFALILKLWFLSIASAASWGYLIGGLVFGGISLAAYYMVFHGMFLDDNDDDKVGAQMGLLMMLGRLSGVIAPFLAALIIENWGFSTMFLVAMVLLIFSIIPLWMMPKHSHKVSGYEFRKILLLWKENPRFSWAVFFWFITEGVQIFLWPIFMYLIVKSFASFGAVGSIVMIFNAAAVYVAGKVYDKRPLRRGFPAFSIFVAITWVMRFLSFNLLTIATADSLNRFFSPLWWMKIRRGEMRIGEKSNSLVFAVSFELLCSIAYIMALLLGVGLLFVSNLNWRVLIPLTAVGTLISTAVLYSDKKLRKN